MSDPVDPLSSLASEIASAPQPSTDITRAAPRKLSLPLIAWGLWGVGLIGILLWWYFGDNRGTAERSKNLAQDEIAGRLSAERDFEWAEITGRDDPWRDRLKRVQEAKIGLTAVAQSAARDPWRDDRWEVEYRTGHTLESYTRELDSVGIEIGLVNAAGRITYLSDLTNAAPKVRTADAKDEHRYYMLWQLGSLTAADKKLFATAKIELNPNDKTQWVAHFFPPSAERQMIDAELKFAGGRPAGDIRRTVFSIKPVGGKFELGVLRQEYQDGTIVESAAEEWKPQAPKPMPPPAAPKPDPAAPENPAQENSGM